MVYMGYTIVSLLCLLPIFNAQLPLTDVGSITEKELVKHGYPFEQHWITTPDGYILTAHRIPYGIDGPSFNRTVVLLMPGLWHSSEVWVNLGPEKSLGFILPDNGFDVWIGNYRGTTWSRKHVKWSPDRDAKQYWNYGVDELGYYDCPAFIDYILKYTQKPNLIYIGESLGASMFFIMGSEKPAYMNKVKLMIAFTPMVDLQNAKTPIYPAIALNQLAMQIYADFFGHYELLPHSKIANTLGSAACSNLFLRYICELIHSFGVGFDTPQLNVTTISLLLNGFPAGSSLKELIQLSQWHQTGLFAKYNYGPVENPKTYGTVSPPIYNLSGITTPISIYYGGHDVLVDTSGVERFSQQLNNVISKTLVENYNDGDFLWANNVVRIIYQDLIKLMMSY